MLCRLVTKASKKIGKAKRKGCNSNIYLALGYCGTTGTVVLLVELLPYCRQPSASILWSCSEHMWFLRCNVCNPLLSPSWVKRVVLYGILSPLLPLFNTCSCPACLRKTRTASTIRSEIRIGDERQHKGEPEKVRTGSRIRSKNRIGIERQHKRRTGEGDSEAFYSALRCP